MIELGHIAVSVVMIRLIPTLCAFTLLLTGTLRKEDLKEFNGKVRKNNGND